MDKKKTGNLIKEARIGKNLTQSELGDLLGVTNKAVSRWENGESFPDVGVLENLASILDIKIQDIVTGSIGANEADAMSEVLRISKLQMAEKKRKIMSCIPAVFLLLMCIAAGYLGLTGVNIFSSDTLALCILMALSFMVTVYLILRDNIHLRDVLPANRTSNLIAVIIYFVSMLFSWTAFVLVRKRLFTVIPDSSVGPVIHVIFVVFCLASFGVLIWNLYERIKEIHCLGVGILFLIGNIFQMSFFTDMLFGLSTPDTVIKVLLINTLTVGVGLAVALIVVLLGNWYFARE